MKWNKLKKKINTILFPIVYYSDILLTTIGHLLINEVKEIKKNFFARYCLL